MIETPADIEELLGPASLGEDAARQQLLGQHRQRLVSRMRWSWRGIRTRT
jgi:hypothetical protein